MKANEQLGIIKAARMPDVINNVRESVYRASATLDIVKSMLLRGDSKETIIDVLNCIEELSVINDRDTNLSHTVIKPN